VKIAALEGKEQH